MLLTAFLKDQLEKPVEDSKKWRMAIIGLKGIAGFFIAGSAMIFLRPENATSYTTLVQFALTGWGGIVGLFLGAQGSVDFKTTSALQQINQNENREEHLVEEHRVITQGEPGAPENRPWGQHAEGEDE